MENRKGFQLKFLTTLLILLLLWSCNIDIKGFFYSVSTPDERFEQSRSMESPPAVIPAGDQYCLLFLSDTHFSDSFSIDLSSLISDAELSAADEIIGTVILGDLVQDGNESDYITYSESIAGATVFSVIGNHDVYNSGWGYFQKHLGPSSYLVGIGAPGSPGSMLLVNIDSANATLGVKQTDWLESVLENERNNYTYCTVVTHSNFFPATANTLVQFSDKTEVYALVDLFSRYSVNYVLTGHSHQLTSYDIFGTSYISLDSLKAPGSHYLLMSAGPAGLSCEVYPLPETE